MANYSLGTTDAKQVNTRLKIALKNGIKAGAFKNAKGTGATGSFRIAEKAKAEKPKKAKKAKAPKKAAGEKKAKKKAAPAKKAAAKKK